MRRHRAILIDELLTPRPGDPYPHGTAEAILLAVEPFIAGGGEELALLDLLSVLSPDGVTRELLNFLGGERGGDMLSLDETLAVLFDASLIEFAGTNDAVVVMHRLTQRVLCDRANHSLPDTLHRAAELLHSATFPQEHARQRLELGEELIRHIDMLWDYISTTTPSAATLHTVLRLRLWAVGPALESTSRNRAIHLATAVHADHYNIQGPAHPDTLAAAHNLAIAYRSAGQPDKAIPLHEHTHKVAQRVFGSDHPKTLTSAHSLAYAYESAGQLDKAIPLFEQNLGDRRRVHGLNHSDTLTAANFLAHAYVSAGLLNEAIRLHEQTREASQKVLGPEHADTLASANNLASAYREAGLLNEAILLFEQTLAVRRRVLGRDHPDTLTSANELAISYRRDGRVHEAIPLHEQTHDASQEVLGLDHPQTLYAAILRASAYELAGRLNNAARLYEQAAVDAEQIFGSENSLTRDLRDSVHRLSKPAP